METPDIVDRIVANVAGLSGEETLENHELMCWLVEHMDLMTATYCHSKIFGRRTDEDSTFQNVKLMGKVTPTAWYGAFEITRKDDLWFFEYSKADNLLPDRYHDTLPGGMNWVDSEQGVIS